MALNINGTTGISGVDGSVSAPAFTGTDSNTGITFPSADTIKFATGGVERMSITNTGVSASGHIIQKVHQQSTTSQTTSGATKLDVLSLSITPASSSNQILLLAQLSAHMVPSSKGTSGVYIYRGGSAGSGTNVSHSISWRTDGNETYANHGLSIIDTPNTTSATTYHLTLARQSSDTNTVSTDGYTYSLIALEIAA